MGEPGKLGGEGHLKHGWERCSNRVPKGCQCWGGGFQAQLGLEGVVAQGSSPCWMRSLLVVPVRALE